MNRTSIELKTSPIPETDQKRACTDLDSQFVEKKARVCLGCALMSSRLHWKERIRKHFPFLSCFFHLTRSEKHSLLNEVSWRHKVPIRSSLSPRWTVCVWRVQSKFCSVFENKAPTQSHTCTHTCWHTPWTYLILSSQRRASQWGAKYPLSTVNNLVYLEDIKRMLCGEMSKPTGAGLMMRREGKLSMFTSPSPIAFLCLIIPVTSFYSNVHKYT